MKEKVLVTGGAGFIGSHIVDALIGANYEVAVVDNLHTGKRSNVHRDARFYQVDIRDRAALESVFDAEHPQYVCHQAALANVRDSLEKPEEYASVNIAGTLNLMEIAWRRQVRKFTMASTGGAIYGQVDRLPVDEDYPAHPLDPYGVSKLAAEHYLYTGRHNHGLDFCALRYGNVCGPRQDPYGEAGVVAIFAGLMLSGQPVTINGDGAQLRDFICVMDVARANVAALTRGSGIYNVGTGIATDINTIFRHLASLTGYSAAPVYGPPKPGETRAISLQCRRAEHELGWKPEVPLLDCLASTVEHMRTSVKRD